MAVNVTPAALVDFGDLIFDALLLKVLNYMLQHLMDFFIHG